MVSPSEKLVSVRDAICWLLVLAVFCSLGKSLGLRCAVRWKQRANESQGGEAHPPLITRDKGCPNLAYQLLLCFNFIPYTRACLSVCYPSFLCWSIFNVPPHLGRDKSRSLCGRVVRDEGAVCNFLLAFSLTSCRLVLQLWVGISIFTAKNCRQCHLLLLFF